MGERVAGGFKEVRHPFYTKPIFVGIELMGGLITQETVKPRFRKLHTKIVVLSDVVNALAFLEQQKDVSYTGIFPEIPEEISSITDSSAWYRALIDYDDKIRAFLKKRKITPKMWRQTTYDDLIKNYLLASIDAYYFPDYYDGSINFTEEYIQSEFKRKAVILIGDQPEKAVEIAQEIDKEERMRPILRRFKYVALGMEPEEAAKLSIPGEIDVIGMRNWSEIQSVIEKIRQQ